MSDLLSSSSAETSTSSSGSSTSSSADAAVAVTAQPDAAANGNGAAATAAATATAAAAEAAEMVAVKVLPPRHCTAAEFVRELKMLAHCRHQYLVALKVRQLSIASACMQFHMTTKSV
jgi:hypothetical protein